MRASALAALVAAAFAAATAASALALAGGYGIPGGFAATYRLDQLGLLAGVSRITGEPVVYEWPVATLLKPGATRVEVSLVGLRGACPGGGAPASIQLTAGGAVYESDSARLVVVLERDSVFMVLKVRVLVRGECLPAAPGTPLVVVEAEVAS